MITKMKKYKLNTKEFEKYNKLNEIDNDMICLIEYLKYHERSMDDILF